MIFNVTYKTIDEALRATKMFELRQKSTISIMEGNFRTARKNEKEFAEIATKDFDTYKTLPFISIKGVGLKEWFGIAWKSLTFKIFKAFTKKTPEERQLKKFSKQYLKEITPEELKKKTISIDLRSPLYF